MCIQNLNSFAFVNLEQLLKSHTVFAWKHVVLFHSNKTNALTTDIDIILQVVLFITLSPGRLLQPLRTSKLHFLLT